MSDVHLSELMAKLRDHMLKEEQNFEAKVERRAVQLAIEKSHAIEEIELLQVASSNPHPIDTLEEHIELQTCVKTFLTKARDELYQQLDSDYFKPPAWHALKQAILRRAADVSGHWSEDCLEEFASAVSTGSLRRTTSTSREISRLHNTGFTQAFIANLWKDYPSVAKETKLPRSGPALGDVDEAGLRVFTHAGWIDTSKRVIDVVQALTGNRGNWLKNWQVFGDHETTTRIDKLKVPPQIRHHIATGPYGYRWSDELLPSPDSAQAKKRHRTAKNKRKNKK